MFPTINLHVSSTAGRMVLPRPGAPARGHYRPKEPRTDVPSRGHCRPTKMSNEATDGLAPSVFATFREFRVLVPTATGSERVLSPGTDVVLEVVRVAANEQVPALLPALYPGSKATDPRPYASLNAMWRAFCDKQDTCRQRRNSFFSPCFFDWSAVIRPVGAPVRRSWARPGPSAAPVAFVADGIEPSFNCHAHR